MAPKKYRNRRSSRSSSMGSSPDLCLVCCEEFDEVTRFMAFGKCNHLGVCSLCYLRLRVLLKDMNCCLCKTTMDTVMVEPLHQVRPFEHYEIWDENAGPDKVYDETSRMFLPKDYYRNFTTKLQEFRCRQGCSKGGDMLKFGSMRKMEDHYRDNHQKYLCHTCLAYKKVFLAEQQLFSKAHLSVHIGKGDPAQGFFGHPRCEFCRCRFYDKEHLYTHLTRDHYSCHLCERAGTSQNRYYKDYADVEDHFRAEHFLCDQPRCLEKKFVVFDNDIDLKAHQAKEHPELGNRVIKLNFKVKRAGHDGSGFDSLDGGISGRRYRGQDGNVHEWEIAGMETREENREMEARARAALASGVEAAPAPNFEQSSSGELQAEDFPGLSGSSASQGGGSWAGRMQLGRGSKPKEEDFPALPPSSQRVRQFVGGGRGAFRNAVQSYATPAMQIYSQQGDEWSYPGAGQSADDFVASLPKTKSKKKKGKKGGGGGGSTAGVDLSRLKQATDSKPNQPPKSKLVLPKKANEDDYPSLGAGNAAGASSAPLPPPPANRKTEPPGLATKMETLRLENPQTRVLNQIKETIGEEKFEDLKALSQQYRGGNLSPSEYYFGAMNIFPPENKALFLALVSQLPDPIQRSAVLQIAIQAPSAPEQTKSAEQLEEDSNPSAMGSSPSKKTERARVSPAARKPKSANAKNKTPSPSPTLGVRKKNTGLSVVKSSAPKGPGSTIQQLPVHNDFPTLGSSANNSTAVKKPPPGMAPPGFNNNGGQTGGGKKKKKNKNKKGTPLMNLALNFK